MEWCPECDGELEQINQLNLWLCEDCGNEYSICPDCGEVCYRDDESWNNEQNKCIQCQDNEEDVIQFFYHNLETPEKLYKFLEKTFGEESEE